MAPDPWVLALAYAACFLPFLIWKRDPILRILGEVRRPAAYFTAASLLTLLIVQVFPTGREAYPFASWTMYTSPHPFPASALVEITRESGTSTPIPKQRIIRGASARGMMHHTYVRARQMSASDATLVEQAHGELTDYFDALVAIDRRRHPDDPIRRVELRECRLLDAPWSVSCDRTLAVWTYGAPDGP